MKTFTRIEKYTEGGTGYANNERKIFVVWADPKREGLYCMTQFQTDATGKTRRYSEAFGKCNQAYILKATKRMIEVL